MRNRYEIVNGIKPADQGEIKSGKGKGVPNFWLTALKANEVVATLIHKQDEDVLQYLDDISWRKIRSSKDDPNCCIELKFCFGANPCFRNSVLTKSYFIDDDHPFFSSLEYAIGTQIGWYAGKELTGSFFDFFALPGLPDYKDRHLRGEQWRSLMKPDYNIGLLICYDVIPHAVSLFTGEFQHTLRMMEMTTKAIT
ncbi:nucleosome assembly protein 1;1-like [Silene latifolia]|uniref:nucleosome assembly protein 1;1-like n=1 Tax=Silene latifolia TaxID=37657 RepID=UPI003D77DD75